MLDYLKVKLRSRGYNTIEHSVGQSVLDLAEEHKPDLVLLDTELVWMNGWEVTRALRGNPVHQSLGIILLTDIDDIVKTREALQGSDDFVRKPYDFDEVATKVAEVLARRRT